MALNTGVAQTSVDFKGLAELRRSATVDKNDQQTLKQVAAQFESLFTSMMLKSMREASLAEGIFDSSQSDMYRDMSDQQLAIDLSNRGGLGLQNAIIRQLGGEIVTDNKKPEIEGDINTVKVGPTMQMLPNPQLLQKANSIVPKQVDSDVNNLVFDSPESFVQQLLPMARQAANKLGVSADVILAQAALETGWGKHVIKTAEGSSSHNLFNIKADSRWQGESTAAGTVEYRQGVAVREQAKFRAYDSYQHSFDDYVRFLQTQPRYQEALKQTDDPEAFIDSLHKAGYATDPAYADKIKKIMNGSSVAQFSQQLKQS